MLIRLLLALVVLSGYPSPSLASSWWDEINDFIDGVAPKKQYPEEKRRYVKVKALKTNIKDNARRDMPLEKPIEDVMEFMNEEVRGVITQIGFNKFTMGTGLVDVTYQVKDGVKYAIEESLAGYPEYQRRKAAEEIINANFEANNYTSHFLLGSKYRQGNSWGLDIPFWGKVDLKASILGDISDIFGAAWGETWNHQYQRSSLLNIAYNISESNFVRDLHEVFKNLSFALLFGLTFLILFSRLSSSYHAMSYALVEPMFRFVGGSCALVLCPFLIGFCFEAITLIDEIFYSLITQRLGLDAYLYEFAYLEDNWNQVINDIGYFPAASMSIVNMLSQIFCYFYITGLILFIIIGKILSPLWLLAFSTDSLRSNGINALINWLKALFTLISIPVIYSVIVLITQAFNSSIFNIDLLTISLSSSALLFIPLISSILLGKNSGILKSSFAGYEILVDTINSHFWGLKNRLETHDWSSWTNKEDRQADIQQNIYKDKRIENSYHKQEQYSTIIKQDPKFHTNPAFRLENLDILQLERNLYSRFNRNLDKIISRLKLQ